LESTVGRGFAACRVAVRSRRPRGGARCILRGMKFRATVELGGKTATGIRVPEAVVASLGAGKRIPVQVTLGKHTYRSTIAPMSGAYMIPLSAENRNLAGVAAGDEVDVTVEVDDAPREVTVPDDLVKALEGEAAARKYFDGLSYSHRRAFVTWIEDAKKPETRQIRLAKTVELLREGKTR
jgi:hypothetical protein